MTILKEWFHYDEETGNFYWIKSPSGAVKVGDSAGAINSVDGYVEMTFAGRRYRAHRLAWWYVYGKPPKASIDHINGIRHDNRIVNLREATQSQQRQNSNSKGVHYCNRDKQFIAKIHHNKKSIYLGKFNTFEEARVVYVNKAKELFGEFAREK